MMARCGRPTGGAAREQQLRERGERERERRNMKGKKKKV